MWLDEGELGEAIRRTVAPAGPEAVVTDADSPPPCPKCGKTMARHHYVHDSGVYLHKCAACRGFWLLAGQIEQLARYRAATPAVQSLETALAADLRSANRWERVHGLIHSRLLSVIVAAACLAAGAINRPEGWFVFVLALVLTFPLACIWYGEGMGRNWCGHLFSVNTAKSIYTIPGKVVAIGGWLLLIGSLVWVLAV